MASLAEIESRIKNGKKAGQWTADTALMYEFIYDLNPTICLRCGMKVSYVKRNNKFCSSECQSGFYTDDKYDITESIINNKRVWIRNCPECDKELTYTRRENAMKLIRLNASCRKCGKKNISEITRHRMSVSLRKTFGEIRKRKGYYVD